MHIKYLLSTYPQYIFLIINNVQNWFITILHRLRINSECKVIFRDSDEITLGDKRIKWKTFLIILSLKSKYKKIKIKENEDRYIVFVENSIKFDANLITLTDTLKLIQEQYLFDQYKLKNRHLTGKIVFDIGANVGDTTLLFASKGAFVYAFEPVPSTFHNLENNIKMNEFTDRVKCYNVGLSDHFETIEMEIDISNSIGTVLNTNTYQRNIKSILEKIELVDTLKYFRENKLDRCNYLKIDCEGCEGLLLKNAEILNYLNPEIVVVEYHNDNHNILINTLSKLFITIDKIPSKISPGCGMIYAEKRIA